MAALCARQVFSSVCSLNIPLKLRGARVLARPSLAMRFPPALPLAVARPVPRFAHTTNLLPLAAGATRRQAALTLALALAATSAPPLAALAAAELSEEQQVIVEAWAVVQRGYVDQQFGGKDWKAIKSAYLKRKYTSMAQERPTLTLTLTVTLTLTTFR